MRKLGKIKTIAVAAISAVALAAPIALAQTGGQKGPAQGGWQGRRGEGDHFGGGMFRGLNLTDDQKAKLQQIRQSYEQTMKPLREQLRAKRQELRQAESGTTFDEALATQKLTEAAAIEAKLMGQEFRQRQEMLAVLTPDQKAQLEQRRQQFRNGHRGQGQSQQQ
jgi:Spy/CpxP family protein refolding chaperone